MKTGGFKFQVCRGLCDYSRVLFSTLRERSINTHHVTSRPHRYRVLRHMDNRVFTILLRRWDKGALPWSFPLSHTKPHRSRLQPSFTPSFPTPRVAQTRMRQGVRLRKYEKWAFQKYIGAIP
ncbi:uncharacterized protein [Fopius arisanus]|uniref:Uncharacterized protein n=1 Tax=Fopius arisanus TaxID=64838 RepID=A0A9R1SXQ7_9HYME|nr:PREDICTED: uncharacterized protein LOC105264108 [Fopius arisanus]